MPVPKRIFLHIGEPKCASSYLQECFRLNSTDLLESGVCYPNADNGRLRISSGNLGGIQSLPQLQEKIRKATKNHSKSSLLLSSEFLFSLLTKNEHLAQLRVFAQSLGYELHLICITRNVLEHSVSWYMQKMKNLEVLPSPELSWFLHTSKECLERRIEFSSIVQELRIPCTFLNVSQIKSIQDAVFEVLDVKINGIVQPPRINRALARNEFQLLSALRFLPSKDRLHLANELTMGTLGKERLKISFTEEEINILGQECNPLISRYNAHMPVQAQISLITNNNSNKEGVSLDELNELFFDNNDISIIRDWFNSRFIRKPSPKNFILRLWHQNLKTLKAFLKGN